MSAQARGLLISLGANVVQFQRDMDQAANITDRTVGKITNKIGDIKSAFAGIGAGLAFGKIVSEAAQAENAMAQLHATLRSTKGAVGVTAKEMEDLAGALKKMSTYDDDAIIGAQALLATFTKLKGDTFKGATKATVDLATKLGVDLKQAALQVGKALNDPIQGITSLHRAGVSFSESQKTAIKALVNTGQAAKAQALILKELQTEFAGSAAAARGTVGGAFEAMKISIDNVFESIGTSQSNGLQGAFNSITTLMDGVSSHGKELSNALLGIAAAATVLNAAKLPGMLKDLSGILVGGVAKMGLPGLAIAGIAAGIGLLVTFKDTQFKIGQDAVTLQNLLIAAWEKTGAAIAGVINSARPYFEAFMKWGAQAGSTAAKFLSDGFVKYLKPALEMLAKFGANIPLFTPLAKTAALALNTVKALSAETEKFGKSIVSRAAELTAKGGAGKAVPAFGGFTAEDDAPVDKKAKKNAEHWAKFIQARKEENEQLAIELNGNKALIPFLKAKAQIEQQIGTLHKDQHDTLKGIFDLRARMQTTLDLNNQSDNLANQRFELEAVAKNEKELIPIHQFLNTLRAKGVDLLALTAEQAAKLRGVMADMLQLEKDRANAATKAFVDGIKEQKEQILDRLKLGKEEAEVEAMLRSIRKENKYLSDAQVENAKQELRFKQQLATSEAIANEVKASGKQTDLLKAQVELHHLIRDGKIEEYNTQMKIAELENKYEKKLTEAQRTIIKTNVHWQEMVKNMAKADALMESIKTDNEKWADKIKEIDKLIASGALTVTPQQYQKMLQNLSPAMEKLKQAATGIGDAFSKAFEDAIFSGNKLGDVLKSLGKDIAQIVIRQVVTQPIGQGISSLITKMFGGAIPLAPPGFGSGSGGGTVAGAGSAPGGTQGFGGLMNAFSGIGTLFNFGKGLLGGNTAAGATSGSGGYPMSPIGSGPGGGGGIWGFIKNILGFSTGGRPHPNQPAIVGENGPELWFPDGAGNIFSNDITSAMFGNDEFTYQQSMFMMPGIWGLLSGMMNQAPAMSRPQGIGVGGVAGGSGPGGSASESEKWTALSQLSAMRSEQARLDGFGWQSTFYDQEAKRSAGYASQQQGNHRGARGFGFTPGMGNGANDFKGFLDREPGIGKIWSPSFQNWVNEASGGIGRNDYRALTIGSGGGLNRGENEYMADPFARSTPLPPTSADIERYNRTMEDQARFMNPNRPSAFDRPLGGYNAPYMPSARGGIKEYGPNPYWGPVNHPLAYSGTGPWTEYYPGSIKYPKDGLRQARLEEMLQGGTPSLNKQGFGYGPDGLIRPYVDPMGLVSPEQLAEVNANADRLRAQRRANRGLDALGKLPFASGGSPSPLQGYTMGGLNQQDALKSGLAGYDNAGYKHGGKYAHADQYLGRQLQNDPFTSGVNMPFTRGLGKGFMPMWTDLTRDGLGFGMIPAMGFAAGGRPPLNRPSIVGERGPELFVPDQAGNILPNGMMNRMKEIAGAGGKTEIHNYSPFSVNEEQITNPDGSRALKYVIAEEIKNDAATLGPIFQALAKEVGIKKRGLVR